MESKMITKRAYFTITVVMLLIIFLFQFTGIIRRKYNDYEHNSFKELTKNNLTERNQYVASKNASDIFLSNSKYIVYIGDIDDAYGKTVTEWCRFTKRNYVTYKNISEYKLNTNRKPEMILLDSNHIDYTENMPRLKSFSDAGVDVLFVTMPPYDIARKNADFMDYCGIENTARKVNAVGIKVFEDFLVGGEIWYTPENDKDGLFSDITPEIPWFTTTTGTKTYIAAELNKDEYKDVDNETMPSMVWRKRYNDSYVFCINADFISDISGIGILNGIVYQAKDYDLYPVVDASSFVVKNFPYFSNESDSRIEKYYSKDTAGFMETVIWPDLTNLSEKLEFKYTFMPAPQFNYSDNKLVSLHQLNYFFRLINEKKSEAGLITTRTDIDSISDKFKADKSTYDAYLPNYEFLSISVKAEEVDEVIKLKNDKLNDVHTLILGSDEYNGTQLFNYVDKDKILLNTPTNAENYTFGEDFKGRCFVSGLGFSLMDVNFRGMYSPNDEDKLWNKYVKKFAGATENLLSYQKSITKCSVSEMDKRIREMLSLNYSYKQNDSSVDVTISGEQQTSRFIFRAHKYEIDSVAGGTFTKIDDTSYVITTDQKNITINLK